MLRYTYIILILTAGSLSFCTKPTDTGTLISSSTLPRLQKVITTGVDSLGNTCSTCSFYQFFKYDDKGRILVFTDSSAGYSGFYNGPHPYTVTYVSYHSLSYDAQGRLAPTIRDSFVYNNSNQVIQRFRRVQSDTGKSYLINSYTYDNNGHLVADSFYSGQTSLVPSSTLYAYTTMLYDASNNVIQTDAVNISRPPLVTHGITLYNYDNRINPYKSMGTTIYLAYSITFLLSTNNISQPGYTYEYYSNGLLKKITYQDFTQEYFYE